MDFKIWEKTIISWLNSLSTSYIENTNEITDFHLKEVIQKINTTYNAEPGIFLKEKFPNLTEDNVCKLNSSIDYLCASTLLLMYISLNDIEELAEIRNFMCTALDTSIQINIVEFLSSIQKYENLFNLSFKKFRQEVFPNAFVNFKEKHFLQNGSTGDGNKTPIKNESANGSFGSPLQGFFQTPKKILNKHSKCIHNMCGDGDHIKHIKKLTDQLLEEEAEKSLLQEKLNIQTQKCSESEMKLKKKIDEINHLKEEWEKESKKNEEEILLLKNKVMQKLENEKKLKGEIGHLENYVSSLESDLSASESKSSKLENQLTKALEKFHASEAQMKDTTELCLKLQNSISDKEKELEQMKEYYENFYNDEKTIDLSCMNGSCDKSFCSPENLGIVVDKLLQEKIQENAALQKTIDDLQAEKASLVNEIESLKSQVNAKSSVIYELQFLEKDLNTQIANLEKTQKELSQAQNELVKANTEIVRLNKENGHLMEKYEILNSRLQEREQVLIKCNNSKILLQINFLKLAEDFKAVQQRLEAEIQNISLLDVSKKENEVETKFPDHSQLKDSKDILSVKCLNDTENETNFVSLKNEKALLYSSLLSDEKLSKIAMNVDNHVDWMESKISLQKTYTQLNENIIVLRAKLLDFELNHKNSLETKSKLERRLEEAEDKITTLQSTNSNEMLRLRQELEEKENKIKELEKCIVQYKKMQELLYEKEVLMKEASALFKENELKIVHEGGDYKSIRSIVFNDESNGRSEPRERQEFSDSLEEVPVNNKTFDIVNLEDRNISDKTFFIKREDAKLDSLNRKYVKSGSTWTISPPSKVPLKEGTKRNFGESWVVPLDPAKTKSNRVKKVFSSVNDLSVKTEETKIFELQKEIIEYSKECERLKSALFESEQKRKNDKEVFEKNQEIIRKNITTKYENQLEHLKNEMKQLYNRELAKHKQEQSTISAELRDQNKRYKEHIDELRNQLWELGEKLLQEQTLKRELERNYNELEEKYEKMLLTKELDMKNLHIVNDVGRQKEYFANENIRTSSVRKIPSVTFPTMPTEDEEEVFDNRFLEDMKTGVCKTERPEDRLKELQYRNSLCLPHLKSSYPGETQFHNPAMFKESDLKLGLLQFAQESQSLTDSDHSMTKSLLPDNKGKKKEQTSYKRPGPPTPSKNGGRQSLQSGDLRLTPRNVLKELNDPNERCKGTPNPLKLLLSSKNIRGSLGDKDENTAPVTPKKKKFFRKPFGARDH